MAEFVSLAQENVDDFDPRKANAPILPFWAVSDLCWIKDRMRRNRLECLRPAGATDMMAIATAPEFSILRELHTRTKQAHGVAA